VSAAPAAGTARPEREARQEISGGLRIGRGPRRTGWFVYHDLSGLPVSSWGLRLRRHAAEFRAELLGCGTDFTRPQKDLAADREARRDVRYICRKWEARAAHDYDLVTGEHYSPRSGRGERVPV
jgi:hypothetical protein